MQFGISYLIEFVFSFCLLLPVSMISLDVFMNKSECIKILQKCTRKPFTGKQKHSKANPFVPAPGSLPGSVGYLEKKSAFINLATKSHCICYMASITIEPTVRDFS